MHLHVWCDKNSQGENDDMDYIGHEIRQLRSLGISGLAPFGEKENAQKSALQDKF